MTRPPPTNPRQLAHIVDPDDYAKGVAKVERSLAEDREDGVLRPIAPVPEMWCGHLVTAQEKVPVGRRGGTVTVCTMCDGTGGDVEKDETTTQK